MRKSLWLVVALVVALLTASCASPAPPDEWDVQRLSPIDEVEPADPTICDDVRALALGSHATDIELGPTLDELARISAVVGATTALPRLNDIRALDEATDMSEDDIRIARHDLLVEASLAIDDATSAACEVPAFSALYATAGFPDCHFEMEIPVAAYTVADDPGSCRTEGRPSFLPCWSNDGSHLPVDCVSGIIAQAVGERWDTAGPAEPVTIDRTIPDEPEGPPVFAPTGAPECADLVALFLDREATTGSFLDFAGLTVAAAGLDDATRTLVEEFVIANEITPSFAEFEALVSELDHATATTCGLPIVSAAASLGGGLDELPCWLETGARYPAFAQTDCIPT